MDETYEKESFKFKVTNYVTVDKDKIKPIPYKSGVGTWNVYQFIKGGYPSLRENMEYLRSTVYKMKFHRDMIVIGDVKGIEMLYDHTKVVKHDLFTHLMINMNCTKGIRPSVVANGYEHEIKKDALMQYSSYCFKQLKFDSIYNLILQEFEKLPRIENSEKGIDIEENLEDLIACLMSKVMTGTEMDPKLYKKYLKETLQVTGIPFVNNTTGEAPALADAMFKIFKESPYIQRMRKHVETQLDDETLLAIIVWMVVFNAYGAIVNMFISQLCSYTTLAESDKELIRKEVEQFLKSDEKSFQKLNKFHYIDQFFLESLRLNLPAAAASGEALNDFILESKSGFFQIKKGDFLHGNRWIAQRDEDLFQNADEFSIHGDKELYTKYVKSFAGDLEEKATPQNHKCTSQLLSTLLLKLLLVFITKCDIEPVDFTSTGVNTGRGVLRACDGPITVTKFMFKM